METQQKISDTATYRNQNYLLAGGMFDLKLTGALSEGFKCHENQ